jgi:mannose-1-phosphate guanylyltransferase / mannose-6-phosphate isomerase
MVNNNLDKYIIESHASIIDVLRFIDIHNMRFVIVVEERKVVGVMTDGDIRRLILSGRSLNSPIVFTSNFLFADYRDDFEDVCDKFRTHVIDFLPILKFEEIHNVLTRHQLHAMLIEDVSYNSDVDFSVFDDITIEHEVFNRPWGFYKTVWLNDYTQVKILTVFPESEISLQKHYHRDEHWIIVKGEGHVVCGSENYMVLPGDYVRIPKESRHRITNTSTKNRLVISEVQFGTYFGEDDIIRFDDKYGRD